MDKEDDEVKYIFGYPIVKSDKLPEIKGNIVFGDFSAYIVRLTPWQYVIWKFRSHAARLRRWRKGIGAK